MTSALQQAQFSVQSSRSDEELGLPLLNEVRFGLERDEVRENGKSGIGEDKQLASHSCTEWNVKGGCFCICKRMKSVGGAVITTGLSHQHGTTVSYH